MVQLRKSLGLVAPLLLGLVGCASRVDLADGSSPGSTSSYPGDDAGVERASCAGGNLVCAGQSCCATRIVPGGTYNRLNDPAYAATVSEFELDMFEVTVGRFRAFLDGYDDWVTPAGAGALAAVPGSGWDPAWATRTRDGIIDWFHQKPPDSLEGFETWTDEPGSNEAMPIAFVHWDVAQQFCIWDGGRLPTEAEWNYAAAGGDQQRTWAWGEEPPSPERASFGWHGHRPVDGASKVDYYKQVGSAPAGAGRWGHMDLNGSRLELVFDAALGDYSSLSAPPVPCVDCAQLPVSPLASEVNRRAPRDWGAFSGREATLPETPPNEARLVAIPAGGARIDIGFRCVRGSTVVEAR